MNQNLPGKRRRPTPLPNRTAKAAVAPALSRSFRYNFVTTCFVFAFLIAIGTISKASAADTQDGDLVIVVNADREVGAIQWDQLAEIFRGTRKFWSDKSRIMVVLPAEGVADAFYDRLGVDHSKLWRNWTAQIYAGSVELPPLKPKNLEQLVKAIDGNKHAISVVRSSAWSSLTTEQRERLRRITISNL